MATMAKELDIRDTLPVATKGGTKSKPVWTLNGKPHTFVKPLTKAGLLNDGKKPSLGKTGIIAKYKAGETLTFVALFRPLPEKAEKAVKSEQAEKPVKEVPVAVEAIPAAEVAVAAEKDAPTVVPLTAAV